MGEWPASSDLSSNSPPAQVGHYGGGMPMLASMVPASLVAYAAICAIAMDSNAQWRRDKA